MESSYISLMFGQEQEKISVLSDDSMKVRVRVRVNQLINRFNFYSRKIKINLLILTLAFQQPFLLLVNVEIPKRMVMQDDFGNRPRVSCFFESLKP